MHCLDFHTNNEVCETKTCFKCGKVGHLVSQCIYKFDKLTCFKCGKKGHKIYDCQILIVSSNSLGGMNGDRESTPVENQKREWMKDDIKRAFCVMCGNSGHLYCTNDHHINCKSDAIYTNVNGNLEGGRSHRGYNQMDFSQRQETPREIFERIKTKTFGMKSDYNQF